MVTMHESAVCRWEGFSAEFVVLSTNPARRLVLGQLCQEVCGLCLGPGLCPRILSLTVRGLQRSVQSQDGFRGQSRRTLDEGLLLSVGLLGHIDPRVLEARQW